MIQTHPKEIDKWLANTRKMLNIQAIIRYHFTLARLAVIKRKKLTNKVGREKGALIHSCGCKLAHTENRRVLPKQNKQTKTWGYYRIPTMLNLRIYKKEMALFKIANM